MSDVWPRTPPRKILLATDLSARSDRALDRAAQLARQWKAKLLVVHAIEKAPISSSRTQFDTTPSWRLPPDPSRTIEVQIRRDVREVVDDLEICIREGDPPDVVMAAAEREEADLIVLGTARSETLGRMLLGNTIENLVRKSPVSVLVVKERPRGAYRHVLTGTDLSEGSRHGLMTATDLFPNANHALMYAFEMPYRALVLDTKLSHDFSEMERGTIKSFLEETRIPEEIRARVHPLIEHGSPERMLPNYVAERDADLVVIGAYSRSLAFHLLIGGTARRIVDTVPSDVLVVRAHRAAEAQGTP